MLGQGLRTIFSDPVFAAAGQSPEQNPTAAIQLWAVWFRIRRHLKDIGFCGSTRVFPIIPQGILHSNDAALACWMPVWMAYRLNHGGRK